ncbi:ABC transporter ATP-binding protein [Aquipuribacter nitratireducens]|uniref:ABC transporter ATP-binding protein n=1 Tax=Aquipuribacter nitratireducens TaxID=650104 RepID=A0ABW0GSF3_9MICO
MVDEGARHATDASDDTATPPGEVMIRLRGVRKEYADGTVAVEGLDLDVRRGELVALVGPSGCGKSTILRMVNRLIEPSGGSIEVDGTDVIHADGPTMRRGIGYVIQSGGLFPHRTVADNVATVPRLVGWDRRRTRERVDELLGLVGLDAQRHGPRYPHELSGGQRQRVGVARALAVDPPVLLMDEPFGAVDPLVRDRLQIEFRRLQQRLGTTVLLVTHDIDEAVRIADRIAVLSVGGRLEQYDAPANVLGAPATEFVADFVGADRGLRRLAVTPILDEDLEHPPTVQVSDTTDHALALLEASHLDYAVVLDGDALRGWVSQQALRRGHTVGEVRRRFDDTVDCRDSLKTGFSEIVAHDAGWLPVLDGERYMGVLTPDSVHRALRRLLPERVDGELPRVVNLAV